MGRGRDRGGSGQDESLPLQPATHASPAGITQNHGSCFFQLSLRAQIERLGARQCFCGSSKGQTSASSSAVCSRSCSVASRSSTQAIEERMESASQRCCRCPQRTARYVQFDAEGKPGLAPAQALYQRGRVVSQIIYQALASRSVRMMSPRPCTTHAASFERPGEYFAAASHALCAELQRAASSGGHFRANAGDACAPGGVMAALQLCNLPSSCRPLAQGRQPPSECAQPGHQQSLAPGTPEHQGFECSLWLHGRVQARRDHSATWGS